MTDPALSNSNTNAPSINATGVNEAVRSARTAAARWSLFKPINTAEEYIQSLRGRQLEVYLLGERVDEPVDHPIIRPSVNALAASYQLAQDEPELATAHSPYTDNRVNRFLHIPTSADDLVNKNRMQRRMGQLTGTCFQRCAGLDCISVMHSLTYDIDQSHGTDYHQRFLSLLTGLQSHNLIIAAGMTDPKGDRSKAPHEQADPDMFMRVVDRDEDGLYVSGAKAHMTGGLNAHWVMVMPTMRLSEADRDYAVIGAVPLQTPGLKFIYGRQSCDTRAMEEGSIDQGNAQYSGQEVLTIFDRVFIPWEHVLMDGEWEFASALVERFTDYHRASYVCKTGLGDVMVGAAATIAEYNGVESASHIKDKLVEMVHLNETIYSSGIASSHEAYELPSGAWINNGMLSNVCKHNVTRFPYEISRLAQDLAGGLMVTLPSEQDFASSDTGDLLERFFKGRDDIPTEDRVRILRLIENMTLGRNAVGYLTESLHGAGSPQAQRIQILRNMDVATKKDHARKLAGIIATDAAAES